MKLRNASWPRELVRLFLRYVAVGIALVPAGILYGFLSRTREESFLLVLLCLCVGFASAHIVWRVLDSDRRTQQARVTEKAFEIPETFIMAEQQLTATKAKLRFLGQALQHDWVSIVVGSSWPNMPPALNWQSRRNYLYFREKAESWPDLSLDYWRACLREKPESSYVHVYFTNQFKEQFEPVRDFRREMEASYEEFLVKLQRANLEKPLAYLPAAPARPPLGFLSKPSEDFANVGSKT